MRKRFKKDLQLFIMQRKILVGNWKLHPSTMCQALQLTKEIVKTEYDIFDICIIPPQLFISTIVNELKDNQNICIGAQNCHYESSGAYTGETSVESLKDIGVKYILCGHSERRILFEETDNIINKKVKKVVESGLTAILCIGESLEEKEFGLVNEVCNRQIKIGLHEIDINNIDKIIIAYEPVWAIGTGKVCDSDQAEKIIKNIRDTVASLYNRTIRVIYGGSVNTKNIRDIWNKDIDGCLVGGASINSQIFNDMIQSL